MGDQFGKLQDIVLTDIRELFKISAFILDKIIKKEIKVTQYESKMKDTQK